MRPLYRIVTGGQLRSFEPNPHGFTDAQFDFITSALIEAKADLAVREEADRNLAEDRAEKVKAYGEVKKYGPGRVKRAFTGSGMVKGKGHLPFLDPDALIFLKRGTDADLARFYPMFDQAIEKAGTQYNDQVRYGMDLTGLDVLAALGKETNERIEIRPPGVKTVYRILRETGAIDRTLKALGYRAPVALGDFQKPAKGAPDPRGLMLRSPRDSRVAGYFISITPDRAVMADQDTGYGGPGEKRYEITGAPARKLFEEWEAGYYDGRARPFGTATTAKAIKQGIVDAGGSFDPDADDNTIRKAWLDPRAKHLQELTQGHFKEITPQAAAAAVAAAPAQLPAYTAPTVRTRAGELRPSEFEVAAARSRVSRGDVRRAKLAALAAAKRDRVAAAQARVTSKAAARIAARKAAAPIAARHPYHRPAIGSSTALPILPPGKTPQGYGFTSSHDFAALAPLWPADERARKDAVVAAHRAKFQANPYPEPAPAGVHHGGPFCPWCETPGTHLGTDRDLDWYECGACGEKWAAWLGASGNPPWASGARSREGELIKPKVYPSLVDAQAKALQRSYEMQGYGWVRDQATGRIVNTFAAGRPVFEDVAGIGYTPESFKIRGAFQNPPWPQRYSATFSDAARHSVRNAIFAAAPEATFHKGSAEAAITIVQRRRKNPDARPSNALPRTIPFLAAYGTFYAPDHYGGRLPVISEFELDASGNVIGVLRTYLYDLGDYGLDGPKGRWYSPLTAPGLNGRDPGGYRAAIYALSSRRGRASKRRPRAIRAPRPKKIAASNPGARGVKIYDRALHLAGRKESGKYRGRYVHDFKTRAPIYGLEDGSILIQANGRALWGYR